MDNFVDEYWQLRLTALQEQLKKNNFDALVVQSAKEAARVVMEKIVPAVKPQSVAFGGSMSLISTGLLDSLAGVEGLTLVSPHSADISMEEKMELRRQGMLVDLYLAGTNAVTETGALVNLDMYGNRVAAITFGPKKVVLFVGRNKIVPDLESAMWRIKDFAAPTNAMRLDCQTPCVKTSECADCSSPGRICNSWTITEKSFPKGRITVILINEDLGL
jgi:L-lactate utilization protein LutB